MRANHNGKGTVIDQREDSDTEYPLVFQCAKCNTILGDSLSWLCAIEDLGTITLSRKFLYEHCLP